MELPELMRTVDTITELGKLSYVIIPDGKLCASPKLLSNCHMLVCSNGSHKWYWCRLKPTHGALKAVIGGVHDHVYKAVFCPKKTMSDIKL